MLKIQATLLNSYKAYKLSANWYTIFTKLVLFWRFLAFLQYQIQQGFYKYLTQVLRSTSYQILVVMYSVQNKKDFTHQNHFSHLVKFSRWHNFYKEENLWILFCYLTILKGRKLAVFYWDQYFFDDWNEVDLVENKYTKNGVGS